MANRLTILGSGPAGYTAAIYAGRANLKPILIDGGVGRGQEMLGAGGQLMITTEVENYPGFEHGIQGPELMQVMRAQALRFNVDVVENLATRVDLSQRPFKIWVGEDENVLHLAQTVIISTGARANYIGLETEEKLWDRGCPGGVHVCRPWPLT